MNRSFCALSAISLLCLAACSNGVKPSGNGHLASEGLSDRLNRSYGYQVDDKGNWVPKTDKRSQYEGRGGSGYFNGNVSKKAFSTNKLNKGSWMGGQQVKSPSHHLSGSRSSVGGENRFNNQQAALDRNLQTPARIEGNHFPDRRAIEGNANSIGKPSDAATDSRRKVFTEPDIIDYRQQRELSIRQSRQLLGRDD